MHASYLPIIDPDRNMPLSVEADFLTNVIHTVKTAGAILVRIPDAISDRPIAFVVMDDDQRGEFTSNYGLLHNHHKPRRESRHSTEALLVHLDLLDLLGQTRDSKERQSR